VTALPRVPLALVHHANQYLIGDTYDNRQGLSDIVHGYEAVLRLHERYGIPANLHLSGVLLEALAWGAPDLLDLIRRLRDSGLVSLLGGTYAENVMPLFDAEYNRRQLREHAWLMREHLGCADGDVDVAWIPERVWSTHKLAPLLRAPDLPGGGFRGVLLDDRLLYPTNGRYANSPRQVFDEHGPYGEPGDAYWARTAAPPGPAEVCRAYTIEGANGIAVVPISANLRYWIPPASDEQWRSLDEAVERVARRADPTSILAYADDLERTAGVGGWDAAALERYARFLSWVAWRRERGEVEAVHVSEWLAARFEQLDSREIQDGTFYEVAQQWGAGEDYRGWWDNPQWSHSRAALDESRRAVERIAAEPADADLLELAWKHLLASGYETAWHEPRDGKMQPTAWANAIAGHARAAKVIAAAARWAAAADRPTLVSEVDVEDDGEREVVICNDRIFAVLTPRHGGRLIYLFARSAAGGRMLIGNPSDDWNFQQEQNRFMDWPPNHPGGLVDEGFEHDRWRVSAVRYGDSEAVVELVNVQSGSRLRGARKRIRLNESSTALLVCYELPPGIDQLTVSSGLSPDYLTLLRRGRAAIERCGSTTWQGAHCGDALVLVRPGDGEPSRMVRPRFNEAGHAVNVAACLQAEHTHLLLGTTPLDAYGLSDAMQDRLLCDVPAAPRVPSGARHEVFAGV
jgi:starch synthase